ncbi:MAG: hypothetical protein HC884_11115 [Chloroflexaceae bacterium]|nr:hypothetical protein [Chloroflexaceae bacterium]
MTDTRKDRSVTLLVGPAASGKTEAAVRILRERGEGSKGSEPGHHRSLLVVASRLQQRHLRARTRDRVRGQGRIHVHQLSGLVRLVIRLAGSKVTNLSDPMRLVVLRSVMRSLASEGHLPRFAPVAHKPGFVARVGYLIAEAQEAMVAPQAWKEAGVTAYDFELASIYERYQSTLEQQGLADGSRRLWLAWEALRATPEVLPALGTLVVDGFDQFTPLQLELIAALARRANRSSITLTRGNGERPAHRRFAHTFAHLVEKFRPAVEVQEIQPSGPPRSVVLAHIEAHLFDLEPPPLLAGVGVLRRIEAADREREVRTALRQVRQRLQEGVPPEQVAILFRCGAAYEPLLREVAAEYGVPLALCDGRPLGESPQVVAFLMLLRLPLENYPRRLLVEVWRGFADGRLSGPFRGFCQFAATHYPPVLAETGGAMGFERAASLLDRAIREAGVLAGLFRLRSVLAALAQAPPRSGQIDEPDPDEDEAALAPAVSPEDARKVLNLLDAFAAWLKPPGKATIAGYVAWVQERYGGEGRERPLEMEAPDLIASHLLPC